MPTYNYRCGACGHEFERVQRITEDAIKTCPSCNAESASRLITSGNFILRGSGWYSDAYSGGSNKKSEAKGESGAVVVVVVVVERQRRRLRRGRVRHELRGRLDLELTTPFTVAPATRSDIHKRSMGEHAGRGPHSPAPGHISERRLFSVRIRDAWPPSPALPPLRGKGGEPLATRWSTRVEAGRCEAKSLAPKRCETIGPSLRQRLSTLPPTRGKGRGRGPRVANSH
jgi:putative FmdB family regulatory protein